MRRFVRQESKKAVYTCYLYEDEAKDAAVREDGFDSLGETMVSYGEFDVFESDVPDFSGEVNAYIVYDKDGNELAVCGYWDVR